MNRKSYNNDNNNNNDLWDTLFDSFWTFWPYTYVETTVKKLSEISELRVFNRPALAHYIGRRTTVTFRLMVVMAAYDVFRFTSKNHKPHSRDTKAWKIVLCVAVLHYYCVTLYKRIGYGSRKYYYRYNTTISFTALETDTSESDLIFLQQKLPLETKLNISFPITRTLNRSRHNFITYHFHVMSLYYVHFCKPVDFFRCH